MKSLIKILTVLLLLNVSTGLTPQKASAQVGVSFQIFYDDLSPYGNWVENPNYGYVWVPGVGAGFSPYGTGGHWVFTDYGWTWVSNYAWGWAPFHYGRWYFDPIYGWIWVPDTVWGPAWVAWNSAPGYYGWAPLEPGWDVNFVIGGRYHIPPERWIFVPDRDIDRPDVEHYYGPRGDNQKIISNSTVINKTYVDNSTHVTYISGPDRNDVQKRTGKQVEPVQVRAADKPGQKLSNNELAIYRPQVQKTAANGEKPKPQKVVPLKEVKAVNERTAGNEKQQTNPSNKKLENKKASPNAAPADRKPQPKQEPQKNVTPENKNPKDNPVPPRENNPANDKDRQQQDPQRDVNPQNNNDKIQEAPAKDEHQVPENQVPPREVTSPNDNTPQQPQRENPQEIKKDPQPQQQPEQPKPQPVKKKKKPR
ncbi:MAG TPA: DUF6600 domain-containing protein [Chitinophagales bacterium]|nr:DUF6600 domain-containing protein [Chitinophagales bacterium]